jgi:hypothetical protein
MEKDHKTRVAVLLRGQTALADLGGHLWRRSIQDRFWDVDFRIVAGVPDTVNSTMSSILSVDDPVYPKEVTQTRISEDQLADVMKNWGPGCRRTVDSRELMMLCHNLYSVALREYWPLSREFADGTHKQLMFPLNGNGLAGAISRDVVSSVVDTDSDEFGTEGFVNSVKLELLQLHYILGQLWSMGESYNAWIEWQTLNPDWHPDILWCTRPDAFNWFPDDAFHKMKVKFTATPGVYCTNMYIENSRPVINDYSFFSTPRELEAYGCIAHKLIETWKNKPELLIGLLNSGSRLQHQLWTLVFGDFTVRSLGWDQAPAIENVLRPTVGLESAVEKAATSPSYDSFKALQKFIYRDFEYPRPNARANPELIDSAWRVIMNMD